MSIYPYNPNDRYKQRAVKRMTRFIFFMVFLCVVLSIGFWMGSLGSRQNLYILAQDKRLLQEENDRIQHEITQMRAQAQTASVRLEQAKVSYEELLGGNVMKDLVLLIKKQVEQGVDVERLRSVILSARPPQNCSKAETKRFVVVTPVYNGPSSIATIQNGISIEGTGESAKNASGKQEAWFDPGQPVEIIFSYRRGVQEKKKGLLPMYHSMVVDNKEYRFTVTAGAKSFAKVTYDHCDYP